MVKLSADSLLSVINDVLDFSKIEAGKLDLNPISFSLQDSVGDNIKTLGLRSDQKGLELTYYIQPDVPDALVGDPDRLRQVITNLVGNAIKFTERGDITVQVEKESETEREVALRFSVTDTGIGIPENKREMIFGAFTQADGSDTRKYGGTGLGLAISARLVALMGGRIWVESEVDEGSTVRFTARFGIQESLLVQPGASFPVDIANMPVLIVDDNATNRRILEQILTNWHMRPASASGGLAALDLMAHRIACGDPFKLVLLDAQMPGMGGFAVAARIKGIPEFAGTIIMMLSSADQHNDASRCQESGVETYLVKPVKQHDLMNSILATLSSHSRTLLEQSSPLTENSLVARRRFHILLAEDNAVNQALITRFLEKRGYSSVIVESGKQALAALESERFDAVLMDVQMPEMNGFEATAAIRLKELETGEHIPIIALTAHAMKGDDERCFQAGMDGYLSKPIRSEELFDTIEGLLSGTSIMEQNTVPGAQIDDTIDHSSLVTQS